MWAVWCILAFITNEYGLIKSHHEQCQIQNKHTEPVYKNIDISVKIFKWNMLKASNSFHKTSGRDGGVYGVFQYSLWFC